MTNAPVPQLWHAEPESIRRSVEDAAHELAKYEHESTQMLIESWTGFWELAPRHRYEFYLRIEANPNGCEPWLMPLLASHTTLQEAPPMMPIGPDGIPSSKPADAIPQPPVPVVDPVWQQWADEVRQEWAEGTSAMVLWLKTLEKLDGPSAAKIASDFMKLVKEYGKPKQPAQPQPEAVYE